MVSPVYDKLSGEYAGRFKFCKVNVDENPVLAARFQVMSIPNQLFFMDGEKVDEMVGAAPEQSIRQMVDGILTAYPTDPAGRLKVILASWMEYNQRHGEKLKKWLEQSAKDGGLSADGAVVEQVRTLHSSGEKLSAMLSELEAKV